MILGFEIIGLFSMRILLGWFSAIFGCAKTKVEEAQLAEQYVAGQNQIVGVASQTARLTIQDNSRLARGLPTRDRRVKEVLKRHRKRAMPCKQTV